MSTTVLVTGASKSIGRAIALGMADRGYDVAINDIDSEKSGLDTLAAEIQKKGQAHYCSSKGAVIEFTRVLAMELGEYGITVNAVCPGIILTEMGRNNLGTQAEIDKWTDATALKRLGEPEDVVGSVAFFPGEDSVYITGQSLNVCGGIIFYLNLTQT